MTITIIWKDNTRQEAWLSVDHLGENIAKGYHAAYSPELRWWLAMPNGIGHSMVSSMYNPVFDGEWNAKHEKVQP